MIHELTLMQREEGQEFYFRYCSLKLNHPPEPIGTPEIKVGLVTRLEPSGLHPEERMEKFSLERGLLLENSHTLIGDSERHYKIPRKANACLYNKGIIRFYPINEEPYGEEILIAEDMRAVQYYQVHEDDIRRLGEFILEGLRNKE